MFKTSQDGVDLIKSVEGLRLVSYADSVGVPTVGYGHTNGVKLGMTITPEQAESMLRYDLATFEQAVNNAVTVSISQHQFDAMVSLAFNVGVTNLLKSDVLRDLNNHDYSKAADDFLHWDHAGGKVLAGLTRRRQAERALFLTSDGQSAPIVETEKPAPVLEPVPTFWGYVGKLLGR